jgi:hypothetical protein
MGRRFIFSSLLAYIFIMLLLIVYIISIIICKRKVDQIKDNFKTLPACRDGESAKPGIRRQLNLDERVNDVQQEELIIRKGSGESPPAQGQSDKMHPVLCLLVLLLRRTRTVRPNHESCQIVCTAIQVRIRRASPHTH